MMVRSNLIRTKTIRGLKPLSRQNALLVVSVTRDVW